MRIHDPSRLQCGQSACATKAEHRALTWRIQNNYPLLDSSPLLHVRAFPTATGPGARPGGSVGGFSGRLFLKGPNGTATRPWKLQARPHAWPRPGPPCLFSIPWNCPGQEKIPWQGHCSWRLPCNNLPSGKLLALLIKDSTHDAHGKACGLSWTRPAPWERRRFVHWMFRPRPGSIGHALRCQIVQNLVMKDVLFTKLAYSRQKTRDTFWRLLHTSQITAL
jgi:hypothetical protein